MVDAARQMLDELMGRHRNKDPSEKVKKVNWDDPEFCQYYMVKFCPHDLFVNTRADLGPCPKLHDDEAKRMYEEARKGARKRQFEDDFIRFCNNMINEVDRKIQKGRQRLLLMNRGEGGGVGGPVYISKYQEQLNNLNARIKKLLTEAEEAGHRGDVDQAQGLTTLCEQLKDEKEALLAQHDAGPIPGTTPASGNNASPGTPTSVSGITNTTTTGDQKSTSNIPHWTTDLNGQQEKQMEVCEVCGAFLIVGDAQQRIEDHLTGKQHLGYARVRKAIDEMHEQRQKEREEEDKRREEERKLRTENGIEKRRSSSERVRDRDRDHRSTRDDDKKRGFGRDYDRRGGDRDRNRYDRRDGGYRERDRREKDNNSRHDRRDSERKERTRRDNDSRKRSRSRSHSRR